jgi:hypothetical protein
MDKLTKEQKEYYEEVFSISPEWRIWMINFFNGKTDIDSIVGEQDNG